MTNSIQDRAARAANKIHPSKNFLYQTSFVELELNRGSTKNIIADAFAGMLEPVDVVRVLVELDTHYREVPTSKPWFALMTFAARLNLTVEFEKAMEATP